MEVSKSETRKGIFLFLGITLALSCVFYYLIISSGSMGRIYGYGIMWSPGLSALITCRLMGKNIADLGWAFKPKYQLWAYLVPMLYSLVAYLIIWLTGWGGFYDKAFVAKTAAGLGWHIPDALFIPLFFVFMGIYGMAGSVATALGEEIGWRGFLTPEVNKLTSYTKTSLIIGCIWSVWHYPLLIFGQYNNGTPAWFGLTCFTVLVVSITFVFTWFWLKSGSLWTGAFLHASHNLFIQVYFTPLTAETGHTKYYTDEFGAVLPVVAIMVAFYFWTRRGELPDRTVATA